MGRSVVASLACLLSVAACAAAGSAAELELRARRLSERVVVFTEVTPWESNHVVVVSRRGLVLVDPGHSPLVGRLLRQAVARELGQDRFAYVVDTHGHWGHSWGAAAFPEAVVVGHANAVDEISADAGLRGRRLEAVRAQAVQTEADLAGLDPDGDQGRATRLRLDHLERIARGLDEPGLEVRAPDLAFSDRLRLDLGDLTLEMAYLGRGHSDSDIVIVIPEERVALLGCFVLEQDGLPVFGARPKLEPDRWLEVLGALLEREPEVEHVVLGQHSLWSREQLAALVGYIDWLWTHAQALEADGVDLETAARRLAAPDALELVGAAGVDEATLDRYHRAELTALWRQLKESAADAIGLAAEQGGAAAAEARSRELLADGGRRWFFDENELNLLGYRLLGEGRLDEAIVVFEVAVERFPESWNVYDSLGEACAARGERERAILLYRRSLELNPANANGVQALERLGAASVPQG